MKFNFCRKNIFITLEDSRFHPRRRRRRQTNKRVQQRGDIKLVLEKSTSAGERRVISFVQPGVKKEKREEKRKKEEETSPRDEERKISQLPVIR